MIVTKADRLGGALQKGVYAQVDAWYHGTRSGRFIFFVLFSLFCSFCFGWYCYLGDGWKYPLSLTLIHAVGVCRHNMHSEHLAGFSWPTFPCVVTYAPRQESHGLLYPSAPKQG